MTTMLPFLTLCGLCFATFFCSYLRIPVLPLFAASLGAGPAQVGLINGAFMVTAGLLSVPAGLVVDRLGQKLPAVAGIAALALSSLLITQCRQPAQMAAVYVLFGAGMAAFSPAMLALVAETVPANRTGQAYGWYTTATYLAMALGPAAGGYLAHTVGLRQVFFISGGLLALVVLQALFTLPRSAPRHRTEIHTILASSAQLLHNRTLTGCLVATFGSSVGFGVFLPFLPLFATSLGHDPARVGLVFAAQALTNVLCRIPIGRLADRVDRRRIVAAGLVCLALGLATMGQATHISAMVGCAVLLGIGMALTYTAIGALIADGVPAVQRGLAMGMFNSCIYFGMMGGSTGLGVLLKRIGYPLGFALAGGMALMAIAGIVRSSRRLPE